ncbi:MAG: oligosaccharide flippase family protein [Lachnospiraceae bacterium]|nr:oligosaccharide flippase family protein [Lachnospiraceae bacterium]
MADIKKAINSLLIKYKNSSKPVKASMWFVICSFMQRGVSMITTPVFSRLLTTEEYGQYSVFSSWLELITIVVTLKLGYAVYMRGLVLFKDDRERFTSSLLGLSTTSITIWLLLYLIFHEFWNNLLGMDTVLMICMFIMMWSTVSFNFWSAQQRVDYKYKELVILTLFVAIAKPVLGILSILIFSDNKVEARIISLAAVEFVAYASLYFRNMFRGKVFFDRKYWIHALRFNVPLIPHYISTVVLNHSDRLMINWLIGASEAGIYSLAYTISQIITTVNTAINNSLHPWIYKHIEKQEYKSIGNVANILLAGVAGLNLCFLLVAPEVVRIFAPTSYYDAIWIFPPVAIAGYFMFMYGFFIDFEFYFEKTQWTTYVSVLGAILNLNYS